MPFYPYQQGAIMGRLVQTHLLNTTVIVEATCAAEANAIMAVLGADFDDRCNCCGIRWDSAGEDMAQELPTTYVSGSGWVEAFDGMPDSDGASNYMVRVWTMPRLIDALTAEQLEALAAHREVSRHLQQLAVARLASLQAEAATSLTIGIEGRAIPLTLRQA